MLNTCIVRRRWSPQAAKCSHSQRAVRVQFQMSDAGGGSGAVYLCVCVYVFLVFLCLCIFVCKQQNTQMSDVRCWQWCCNPICCISVFVFVLLCSCICVCVFVFVGSEILSLGAISDVRCWCCNPPSCQIPLQFWSDPQFPTSDCQCRLDMAFFAKNCVEGNLLVEF